MVNVGIDVSKGKSMVCILRPYGEVMWSPFEIQHTEQDLMLLVEKIHALADADVRVVLEATGIYHLPIVLFLQQHNIFVSIINPPSMKKYASIVIAVSPPYHQTADGRSGFVRVFVAVIP